MKLLVLGGTLLVSACAAPLQAQRVEVPDDDTRRREIRLDDGAASVRLTTKEPPARRYELVGAVTGESRWDDTWTAARDARIDLRNRARALEADVVMIDQVYPPRDTGRRRRIVVFAGRAFREKRR